MTDSSHMSKQNSSYKDIPQGYPTWGEKGGKIPMKTCSEQEILEQLQIPRFIIPPYHVISQYDGGIYIIDPNPKLGCPISYPINKLGCP